MNYPDPKVEELSQIFLGIEEDLVLLARKIEKLRQYWINNNIYVNPFTGRVKR